MTTKPKAHQNQIIAEIVAALKAKLTELEKQPGRCETCPAGPCEYCEFRGVTALLRRAAESEAA
jgi:hypothetical protein